MNASVKARRPISSMSGNDESTEKIQIQIQNTKSNLGPISTYIFWSTLIEFL